jgi:hypothetical protein
MNSQLDLTRLEKFVSQLKSAFIVGLNTDRVQDLGFIGKASNIYVWHPSLMIDVDIFVFVEALERHVGSWFLQVRDELTRKLALENADFELRIIEGPYKPSIARLSRAVVVAHLGVFTEPTYLAQSRLKRWAWRKYPCVRDVSRLGRLAPSPPDLKEVLNGDKGVRHRLRSLQLGRVKMREWLLPDFNESPLYIDKSEPNFIECCFSSAANCARHHCRGLGLHEADEMGNEEFFPWYCTNVFRSQALGELIWLKTKCRNRGFDIDVDRAQALAVEYLSHLEHHLNRISAES